MGNARSIINGIIVLDNKPASRLERADETLERCITLWHMNEHEARMNEIEGGFGQRIGAHIMTAHFEIGATRIREEARIDVRREHVAFGADAIGKPSTDGSAAASDFQALPTPSHASAERWRIVSGSCSDFQTREPLCRFALCCIVENVVRHADPAGVEPGYFHTPGYLTRNLGFGLLQLAVPSLILSCTSFDLTSPTRSPAPARLGGDDHAQNFAHLRMGYPMVDACGPMHDDQVHRRHEMSIPPKPLA